MHAIIAIKCLHFKIKLNRAYLRSITIRSGHATNIQILEYLFVYFNYQIPESIFVHWNI